MIEVYGVALTTASMRSILIYGVFIAVLVWRPAGVVRAQEPGPVIPTHSRFFGLLAVAVTAFAAVPWLGGDYAIGVALNLLMWIALTQSWVVLSAMTGYVSLGHAVSSAPAPM